MGVSTRNFVTLNRFCPLRTPPPLPPTPCLFLTDKIKMGRIPTKIRYLLYIVFQVFKVFLIKIFKMQPPDILVLLFLLAFTSAGIIFLKFGELHSVISEKKYYRHEFFFLRDSLRCQIWSFDRYSLTYPIHS